MSLRKRLSFKRVWNFNTVGNTHAHQTQPALDTRPAQALEAPRPTPKCAEARQESVSGRHLQTMGRDAQDKWGMDEDERGRADPEPVRLEVKGDPPPKIS